MHIDRYDIITNFNIVLLAENKTNGYLTIVLALDTLLSFEFV